MIYLFYRSELTTALSEALGNSGSGADKLRQIINPYFELLVETCVKYGGDIFKFAVCNGRLLPDVVPVKSVHEV
jgi:hypothetical protein